MMNTLATGSVIAWLILKIEHNKTRETFSRERVQTLVTSSSRKPNTKHFHSIASYSLYFLYALETNNYKYTSYWSE